MCYSILMLLFSHMLSSSSHSYALFCVLSQTIDFQRWYCDQFLQTWKLNHSPLKPIQMRMLLMPLRCAFFFFFVRFNLCAFDLKWFCNDDCLRTFFDCAIRKRFSGIIITEHRVCHSENVHCLLDAHTCLIKITRLLAYPNVIIVYARHNKNLLCIAFAFLVIFPALNGNTSAPMLTATLFKFIGNHFALTCSLFILWPSECSSS